MDSIGEVPKPVIKKISEAHPTYTKEVSRLQGLTAERNIFGEKAIKALDSRQGTVTTLGLTPEQQKELLDSNRSTSMDSIRNSLADLANNPRTAPRVTEFFLLHVALNKDLYSSIYGGESAKKPNPRDLLDPTVVDNRTLEKIVRNYAEFSDWQQRELTESFKSYLPEYHRELQEFIRSRGLDVDQDVINHRLSAVQALTADPLVTRMEDAAGSFNAQTGTIFISLSTPKEKQPHTSGHELTHLISGRTITSVDHTVELRSGPARVTDIEHQRIGLRIGGRFRWLNEATTEKIILAVEDQKLKREGSLDQGDTSKDSGVYRNERELLDLLLTSGEETIPEKLHLEAYFENFDPKAEPHNKIPKWNQFTEAVNQAYQPGFLVALDKYVSKKGVTEAVNQMKEDWKKISEPAVPIPSTT